MSEHWETSLYPIVKDILETNTIEEEVSDNEIVILSNLICKEFDKKYLIIKRKI